MILLGGKALRAAAIGVRTSTKVMAQGRDPRIERGASTNAGSERERYTIKLCWTGILHPA